jgi:hypothetical protein
MVGLVSAATAVLTAAPASAATWTINPAGNFTGSAGTTVLTNTRNRATVTCTSSSASGNVPVAGSGLSGTGIAQITGSAWNNCSGLFGISFTVSHVGTWSLNAVSYSAPVTTGTISGVKANLNGGSCVASVGGATSAGGTVPATYNNTTHVLQVQPTGTGLKITSASSGCLGALVTGDTVTFSGSYTVSPPVTITSP